QARVLPTGAGGAAIGAVAGLSAGAAGLLAAGFSGAGLSGTGLSGVGLAVAAAGRAVPSSTGGRTAPVRASFGSAGLISAGLDAAAGVSLFLSTAMCLPLR